MKLITILRFLKGVIKLRENCHPILTSLTLECRLGNKDALSINSAEYVA